MESTHTGHVVVTDDSLTVRMMLRDALEGAGYQVSLYEDGESCVAALADPARPAPDVVLLDLVLPGMDGLEVLKSIKSGAGAGGSGAAVVPVILLTAMGSLDDRIRGLDQGADDYVAKPFEPDELLARVRAQIRIKRLQDELNARNDALQAAQDTTQRLVEELEQKNQQLAILATTDSLSGLANRGAIEEFLRTEAARAIRFSHPLSALMVDVDHFKNINDTRGHPFGDQVIRTVAQTLAAQVRTLDRVGRYGGEEFIAVLPGTPLAGALVVAERIRAQVAATDLDTEGTGVTVSVGVAEWTPDVTSWEALIAAADRALYDAKESGRNRVCSPAPAPGVSDLTE